MENISNLHEPDIKSNEKINVTVKNYIEQLLPKWVIDEAIHSLQLVRGRARDYVLCTGSLCPLPRLGSA